jgi:hypothetical protein
MILTSFAVGGLWFIYGEMLDDNFVKIPNFLGFALATVQLVTILRIHNFGQTVFGQCFIRDVEKFRIKTFF